MYPARIISATRWPRPHWLCRCAFRPKRSQRASPRSIPSKRLWISVIALLTMTVPSAGVCDAKRRNESRMSYPYAQPRAAFGTDDEQLRAVRGDCGHTRKNNDHLYVFPYPFGDSADPDKMDMDRLVKMNLIHSKHLHNLLFLNRTRQARMWRGLTDNPEYQAAQKAGIPMLSRAQLLGQMMNNYGQSGSATQSGETRPGCHPDL